MFGIGFKIIDYNKTDLLFVVQITPEFYINFTVHILTDKEKLMNILPSFACFGGSLKWSREKDTMKLSMNL